ncbi:membrane-associated lipoprotein involved in thiamine biosynthesis [Sphaerochaeta pleomorpha str. Grapes]|uniref:FAD:protein FMN transferase n=2 Tax=Sphaerochaeta TaxID=399320 RepID=G8QRN9_SPHPG|nr:membrane-associated lipoprotein involved in thiamine biosynthesis [Sphaerochaeta pleomorpha str. Grapes]
MEQPSCASKKFFGMNTEIECKLFGEHAKEAMQAIQLELHLLENLWSRYLPSSDIGKINTAAGKEFVTVAPETFALLSQAKSFSKLSEGVFNVMVGPLVDLWDYKHAVRPPTRSMVKKVLPLTDPDDLVLTADSSRVGLRKLGQSIDVGGIAKGCATDYCVGILDAYGISSAFINIGGNVVVRGTKPEGNPWKVGIRHPRKPDSMLGVLDACNTSIVTSGDYERFFIGPKGKRWHHILDSTTGYPVQSAFSSVTVVYGNSLVADALSTLLFMSGIETGLEILSRFPGAEAVFADSRLCVLITPNLVSKFHIAEPMELSVVKRKEKNEKHNKKKE